MYTIANDPQIAELDSILKTMDSLAQDPNVAQYLQYEKTMNKLKEAIKSRYKNGDEIGEIAWRTFVKKPQYSYDLNKLMTIIGDRSKEYIDYLPKIDQKMIEADIKAWTLPTTVEDARVVTDYKIYFEKTKQVVQEDFIIED